MRFRLLPGAPALALVAACHARAPAASCRIVADTVVSPARDAVPIALAVLGGRDTVALLLSPLPDGQAHVTLVRERADGTTVSLRSFDVARAGAVNGFVATPDGPAFAMATARGVSVTTIDARGVLHDTAFPRGETPAESDPTAPSIALATDPGGGFAALESAGAGEGTRRTRSRDVVATVPWTPRRRDTFGDPALQVTSHALELVQSRRVGRFTEVGDAPPVLELESLPLDAFSSPRLRPVVLGTLGTAPARPRLATREPEAATLVALYQGRDGLVITVVQLGARPVPGPTVALAPGAPVARDVAALPDGALFAWIDGGDLVARAARMEGTTIAFATPARLPLETHAIATARVAAARFGARVLVAVGLDDRVRLFDARAHDGATTLVPIALPATLRGTLAGLASDETRAVLAVATAHDATGTRLAMVTVPPTGALRREVASVHVASDVRDLALIGPAWVLAGRGLDGGIRLDRVDATSSESATVTAYQSHGDSFVMAASALHDRVWVAEAREHEDESLGAAQSVTVQSFVGGIEDGPRTDVRAAVVPWADFDRVTLRSVTPGATRSWAATLSDAREAAGACLPGAWLLIEDEATSHRWTDALRLLAGPEPSCDDRVGDIVWTGARFAATVSTPSHGAWLVTGDAAPGDLWRSVPLASQAAGFAPGVARASDGTLFVATHTEGAAWLARYTPTGDPRESPMRLGAVRAMPEARLHALPVAVDGGSVRVGYASASGARIVRVRCGD